MIKVTKQAPLKLYAKARMTRRCQEGKLLKQDQAQHPRGLPPSRGWLSIVNADPTVLQSLGKSEAVLSLLTHLPYILSPV